MQVSTENSPEYLVGGAYSPAERVSIASALNIIQSRLVRGDVMRDPESVGNYLALYYAGKPREEFVVLMLDSQHRLICTTVISLGTINSATVHPREVVREVLAANAASVILAHNHPSGVPEPSVADRSLTSKVVSALAVIDVRVLDHVVIGGTETVSFAARGWV